MFSRDYWTFPEHFLPFLLMNSMLKNHIYVWTYYFKLYASKVLFERKMFKKNFNLPQPTLHQFGTYLAI